ncbi:MAG: tetratricopeptide repeat protein [Pirellulales bacterium]|nr:tetratricopeptide repeat protein [Pirellulales bacterium]
MKLSRWAPRAAWAAALALVLVGRGAPAQDATEAGNRAYRAAAALQRGDQFELAADAWNDFLQQFPDHGFAPQASLNLGICCLQANRLDQAIATLGSLVEKQPKFDLLDAAYLYLGVARFNAAKAGQAERYADATASFDTLIAKYPKSKHLAEAIYYRGECDYAQGKKKEAAGWYERLVKEYPNDELMADALYALGTVREELGEFEKAGAAYDAFREKFPKHDLIVEVGMRRGETLFGLKQYEAAAEWFAYAAQSKGFALADHALLRQAASLAQLKKYPEAAALYAAVAVKFPESKRIAEAELAAGKCYYLAGQWADARGVLEKVLAAGGALVPEAAHWTARSLLKEGKSAEALAAVENALPAAEAAEKDPFAVELLLDRADALYELPDRRAESIDQYASLAEKYPDDPAADSALYMAGFAALGQGEHARALGLAEKYLKKYADSPLRPDVTAIAAEAHLLSGDHAEAERLFGQLLDKHAGHRDAESWKVRRGLALHLQKKHAEVVAALEGALGEIHAKPALAEAHYLVGASQEELGQHGAAIASLSSSLAADPKWRQADDALLLLANAYYRGGDPQKAAQTARRLLAEFPESRLADQANYWLGEFAYAQGDMKTAAAQYETVLAKWPTSPLATHALYGLGWAKLQQGDPAGAEKTLDRLVAEFPDNKLIPRARFARGTARQQQGKFAPAIEDLQTLLAADPTPRERSDARYVLGLCQVGLKQHAEAVKTFEAMIQDDPKYGGSDKTLYELAWALKSSGNQPEALRRFAQLAKEHPDSPLAAESLYLVAEGQYDEKKFAEAAAAYYDVGQKASDSGLKEKASYKLGWSYFNQDKFNEAQETFAFLRRTFPEGKLAEDAAFMQGECFRRQGKHAEALAAYESVKEPTGKDFKVLGLLHAGQAAAQLGQWDASLKLLADAVARFPESEYLPEILYEQGAAQQNLGKPDEAVKLYQTVVAKTNREVAARALFMVGELQFDKKEHAEAIKTFYQVIYGYSYPEWQASATYEAARCFEVLERPEQAVKLYKELIEKYPNHDKAALAKKRLESMGEKK